MTKQTILALGIGMILVGQGVAQDAEDPGSKPKKPEPSAENPLEPIKKRFQAELDELQKEYRAAKTPEQRKQTEATYAKLQQAVTKETLEIATANRPDGVREPAFTWIFRAMVDDKARQIAKKRWLERHINDARLAPTLAVMGMSDDREFLRDVVKKSTNKSVLGSACFNLAMSLRREDLSKKDEAEIVTLLERVTADYANQMLFLPGGQPGGKLGDLAAPPLYELKFLTAGKVAPEIAGEDIAGDKLVLSEYRGRVVMLSFWGDW